MDTLRSESAWIARRSTMVRVVEDAIPAYAQQLSDRASEVPPAAPSAPASSVREDAAAFWLTLDAINFGSGWFPTLRKRAEKTGYRTIAAGVERRFAAEGRWTPPQLVVITAAELAGWLDQDPEHELIDLMVKSLRDLGEQALRLYGRSFAAIVDSCHGSAIELVETLARWSCFSDSSTYDGRQIPFLKRAQIAAADLHRSEVAHFEDLERLTMFADNLVPHVLRLDGLLWFDHDLAARIEREELIEHGSPEEIEIRACAVHAVELISAAASQALAPAAVDQILWNRGQKQEYKSVPRHRSRTTAY